MKEFLRNKRTILTIFILVLIFISSLIVSIQFLTPKKYRIGVITFLKEIMSQRDAEKYLSQIYYVYRSNDIKGIILYIDCPGGAASPIEAIYYALKTLGKEKPIVAYVGGLAASGGYYIAVSAEYIIVSPSSILGNSEISVPELRVIVFKIFPLASFMYMFTSSSKTSVV